LSHRGQSGDQRARDKLLDFLIAMLRAAPGLGVPAVSIALPSRGAQPSDRTTRPLENVSWHFSRSGTSSAASRRSPSIARSRRRSSDWRQGGVALRAPPQRYRRIRPGSPDVPRLGRFDFSMRFGQYDRTLAGHFLIAVQESHVPSAAVIEDSLTRDRTTRRWGRAESQLERVQRHSVTWATPSCTRTRPVRAQARELSPNPVARPQGE